MYCMQCGAEMPDNVGFCPKCGAKVKIEENKTTPKPMKSAESKRWMCISCDRMNDDADEKCKYCGTYRFRPTVNNTPIKSKSNQESFGDIIKKDSFQTRTLLVAIAGALMLIMFMMMDHWK